MSLPEVSSESLFPTGASAKEAYSLSLLHSIDIGNLLFLKFMKDSSLYNAAVWLLWFCIGLALLLITMAFDSPQLLFTLYGAGAFIILMSFTAFL